MTSSTLRQVSANGARFAIAEAGTGPLVLLLHGFPQYSWAWRHQLQGLADLGFRAVAPDLRGHGGSDKPPRGYDGYTLAADIAGLVRALGEREAMLVGSGEGGLLAWTTAALHPQVVRRLAVLAAPHPLRLRTALVQDPRGQLVASAYALAFQPPGLAEAVLTRSDAVRVEELLTAWSGPRFRASPEFATAVRRYRDAIQEPGVAHSALEYFRWVVRAAARPSGWRLAKLLSTPVGAPTLQLHGQLDPCMLPRTAQGSGRYVAAGYEWRVLDDVGHFPAEEAPDLVTGELARWAKAD